MRNLIPPDPLLQDDEVTEVLERGDHAYLAVETRNGPHVTPQVHLSWGGRLWMVVARDTLKARALERRPRTCAIVRWGERSVIVRGEGLVLDLLNPGALVNALPEALVSGPVMARYLHRNRRDLSGFVRDALGGKVGSVPAPRVLVALRPAAVGLLDGRQLIGTWGAWRPSQEEASSLAHDPHGEIDLTTANTIPDEAARLLDTADRAVLGWETGRGPVAFPVEWDPKHRHALLSKDLFALSHAPEDSRACLTFDAIDEHHPDAKYGVVLRGWGHAATQGETVGVSIEPDRATWWRGTETRTGNVS